MNFSPRMIKAELERVREQAEKHVDHCAPCLGVRPLTNAHKVRLFAEVRQTFREHVQRCHTCRTRGEAAQLEHHKAVLREYVIRGAKI